MKVTLLNVKYSPNLGDGIIAECFEHGLTQIPGIDQVESCDLAGRLDYSTSSNKLRQTVRSLLDKLPKPIRRVCSIAILRQLVASRLRHHYKKQLKDTDVAVIGGGQLIADAELNFPIKIYEASVAARKHNAQLAIYGVGVGSAFSKTGKSLFKKAFSDGLVSVNVRDELSANRWTKVFGGMQSNRVWDPGILSDKVYGAPNKAPSEKRVIGIGVTQPATLNLHADNKSKRMKQSDWIKFYQRVISDLRAQGFVVELFTNGAQNDQIFAGQILNAWMRDNGETDEVRVTDAPTTPKELAHLIAGYDAIIAHRLHANIIAFSYRVPHVGLGWDSKMDGFFQAIKRSEYLVPSPTFACAEKVVTCLTAALDNPIDEDMVRRTQEEVQTQIHQLGSNLVSRRSEYLWSSRNEESNLQSNGLAHEYTAV